MSNACFARLFNGTQTPLIDVAHDRLDVRLFDCQVVQAVAAGCGLGEQVLVIQLIEVAPGLDIEPLTDVAVKHADVKAGILVVERQFGYLEIHGGTDEVQASASAVLGALGATARDASRPEILASKIITMLDPQQAFLVNRNKIGSMALAGESLFVLEMRPASYAILAANEAEKAARIKLVDYRMIGATGRLYLSGSEADVRQAAGAAEDSLRNLG